MFIKFYRELKFLKLLDWLKKLWTNVLLEVHHVSVALHFGYWRQNLLHGTMQHTHHVHATTN